MSKISHWLSCVWAIFVVCATTLGPTHISGTLQSESGNQDRRPKTWQEAIQYLDPDRTLFTQLLTRLDQKETDDPEFKLFEREHRSKWTRANEAIDASETGIDVDDGSMFRAGEIILIDDEYMEVSSIAANTLTVVRASLGSTAATHDDDTWILSLFEKQKEFGLSGTPITTDYTTITNFIQTFKVPYALSDINKRTKKRGPSDLKVLQQEALSEIKRQIEHMILWGKKRVEVTSGDIYRYSGGLNNFVTTNRLDAEGGLGFGDIGWIVNQSTRYGGKKKLWFCGRDARQQLDGLGLEFMRIGPKDNILGMAVEGVRTSFGEFMVITHHGLENAHAGYIFIVDPAHIRMAVFNGGGIRKEDGLEENDRAGEKHQYIADMGLWLDTEKAHTIVYNVSDGTL